MRYRFRPAGSGSGFGPGMTPMVMRLLIANVAIFIIQNLIGPSLPAEKFGHLVWRDLMEARFGITPILLVKKYYLWQPFTYMFLHGGMMHVVFNMFGLWMFGSQLERTWGSRNFLKFYLFTGVGAGFTILIFNYLMGWMVRPTIGASGALFGLIAAYAVLYPYSTIYLMGIIPMSSRTFAIGFGVFSLMMMVSSSDGISHIGHLGGLVIGYLYLKRGVDLRSIRLRWNRWRLRRRLRVLRDRDDDDINRMSH